jgi:hypothetical protein
MARHDGNDAGQQTVELAHDKDTVQRDCETGGCAPKVKAAWRLTVKNMPVACPSGKRIPVLTSPICLAEHLVEFGVGPELSDLLRTAAGDGDLGCPLQRLFA